MSRYRKLTKIAAVGALAFGLAACGGGDSGPTTAELEAAQQAAAEAAAAAEKAAAEKAAAEAAAAEAAEKAAAEKAAAEKAAAEAAEKAAAEKAAAEAAAAAAAEKAAAEKAAAEKAAAEAAEKAAADLMETQKEAADAAAAAMEASTNAGTAADGAEAATANIATLQTNGMAAADAMAARAAADEAMAASEEAQTASDAAAEATTGADAEAAAREALNAQGEAEDAEMTASGKATAAIAAAKTELHIDGSMNNVGDSSVDAKSGRMTTPGKPDVVTGLQIGMERLRSTVASEGQHFEQSTGPATETKYKQAVAAGTIMLGKVLDTSDDKARLTLITSHQDSKKVRVFADGPTAGIDGAITDAGALVTGVTKESIGIYYEANDREESTLPAAADVVGTPVTTANALDAYDQVDLTKGGKPTEIFELSATDGTAPIYVRVLTTTTNSDTGTTASTYRRVDIMADASMTDDGDNNETPQDLAVTVSIPVASAYSHINFGVWASLGSPKATGSQDISSLGIGFVQNIDSSGVTDRQGIGTATFNGDWVAAVRREYASDAEAGSIEMDDGKAVLTADFEKGKFTGALAGLATLEGTLANNGFSGMTAKAIAHDDLDNTGKFAGSFSGAIYGPAGSEAAGVFDFDGGEAGAFRGAFGGAQ